MKIKERVYLPMKLGMKLCDQGKHSCTDSLSPKMKPHIITCKILHESSVCTFARAHADY